MRIAVISPYAQNNGNTTLAMLIGLEFASSNKLTCITHVKPTSNSFKKYLAFRSFTDKTSTPSQIVKILKEGGLTGDEARDYCRNVAPNLEAFTNDSSNFTEEDMIFMYKYMAKMFPHENVIFDVDESGMDQCKSVVRCCDVVVLNITQSIKELSIFKEHKDEIMKVIGNKPILVVVNKYHSTAGSLKEVAAWMGVKKPVNWLTLHYNPWITWATNHGKLNELFRTIQKKDPRVIELQADLSKICSTLSKAKSSGDKAKK